MADDPRARGADIEIYEETDTPDGIIVPRFIRINGVDIGYTAPDSLHIDTATRDAVRVTLTLLPRSVTIHQIRPDPTEEPFWVRKRHHD